MELVLKTLYRIKVDNNYEWACWAVILEENFPNKIKWRAGEKPSGYNPKEYPTYVHFGKEDDIIILAYDSEYVSGELVKTPEELITKLNEYFGGTVKEDKVDDHKGMVYNPITGEWRWF